MGGNDPLVAVVERHGIHTYSTAQIAAKLLDLCTAESREQALKAPLDVDLTGGLGSEPIDIKALRAEAMADAEKEAAAASSQETDGLRRRKVHWTVRLLAWAANQGAAHPIVTKQASATSTTGPTSPPSRKTKSSSFPSVSWARGAPVVRAPRPSSASTRTAPST